MNKKLLVGIIGGVIGFVIGTIGGGFLGLVVGGTFLGGLEFLDHMGIQGYELAAYVGVVLGVLIITPLGVRFALSIMNRDEKKTIM